MPADPSKPQIEKLVSDVQLRSGHLSKRIPSASEDIRDDSTRRWDVYLSKSLVALALLSGIVLTFYIFITYRVLFHSDSAMFNLLADEIIRTRQFFPADWYYINDIWILTPHLLIVPLALLFHESFLLHALACFVFTILFAASLYLLCNVSGLERKDFLFAISLIFTGLSPLFAENLFGQFAYGGSVASTFVVIALVFSTLRAYNQRDRRKLRVRSGLLIIFLSIVLASGVRGLLVDVVPSLATVAVLALFPQTERRHELFRPRALLYVGLLIVIAVVFGMASFAAIRTGVHFQADKSAAHYVDYQQLESNIGIFFDGFLEFTGAMPTPNKSPVSVYGFITAYRLFWFGIALLLPFWLLFRYRSITNPHFRFLIIYYVFSFVLTFYLYVFSSLPQNVFTFRYFVNPCMLAIVLIGYGAKELRLRFGTKSACLVVAACLPIYASSYDQLITPYFRANASPITGTKPPISSVRLHENPEQSLADHLVSQHLRYGYATYWNAGVLTILSGEKTRVSPVLLTDPILPFRWLVAAHAYAADAFRGRTFLLLTDQEYSGLNKAVLEAYLGPPESTRNLPGYRIMVYGFNIAAKLPDWGKTTDFGVDDRYPPTDLRADLDCKIDAITLKSGQPGVLRVEVTNRGSKVFASRGRFPINLGVHLYSQDLQLKAYDYVHSALPHVVKSGETVEVPTALPVLPRGEYILEISMVQESVAWFGAKKDGQPLRIKVKVL